MSTPHHPEHPTGQTAEHPDPNPHAGHANHTDHAAHHPADADTHGQAMPQGHAHSALDEDHQVHDHGQHAGHSTAMFKNRFWVSLVLSIPVVFFSHMVGQLLGYHVPEFPGSAWIAPVLGTVIYLYGGMPFLKGGLTELRARQPGMMLLIAMAITVAFVASWVTTLGIGGFDLDFWWELALLVVIMLLGHWLEMRALGSASSALDALAALLPDEGTDEGDAVRYWLHYAEGSAMPPLVMTLQLNRAAERVPPEAGAALAKIRDGFVAPGLERMKQYWNDALAETGWFAGPQMTVADIMMSFPIEAATHRAPFGEAQPNPARFLERIHARPAYRRALERGGPYAYA